MAMKTLALAVAALAVGTAVASAQPAQAQDPHHPGTDGAGSTQTKPVAPPSLQRPAARGPMQPGAMPMQPGGQGMMMGGDMAQMMTMMQMMQGSGMMPMGMGLRGGDPFRHIEGQIAYYKAELKITDAQATEWNAFADALRTNATHLQQAMMKAKEAQAAVTAPEQMERRIAMLTELRDAMQTMLAATKPLYATLSDEQKRVADELMAEHMMTMRARGM
jgi:hypothetical protein